MERPKPNSSQTIVKDLLAGLIVFLVALPLCLGIALASGAPLFSGLIAGIIGGVLVGSLSGSHTAVSGPAAGLTAIVAAQIANLGSFEAFLLALVVGGLIQIGLGIAKAGELSAFFPSSVIKGLLAAIIGRCSQIKTPGVCVAIGENSPRISSGERDKGWVAAGDCSPAAPADPYVRDYRIRFLK